MGNARVGQQALEFARLDQLERLGAATQEAPAQEDLRDGLDTSAVGEHGAEVLAEVVLLILYRVERNGAERHAELLCNFNRQWTRKETG